MWLVKLFFNYFWAGFERSGGGRARDDVIFSGGFLPDWDLRE
jgi:hypothetical protein